MDEIAKELLDALKLAEDFLCGPTAWTTKQEDNLVEKVSCAIAKAEAAMAEPQPDADGWVKFDGGGCPVPDDTWVEVLLRNGENIKDQAADCLWHHGLGDGDIIAYRIVKEPQ